MRVLGIDPGTGRMGWAVIEVENRKQKKIDPKLMISGLIETPANTPLPQRLDVIYHELSRIITKYKPEELAIEELFFVKNVKTAISVSHARGVAILAAEIGKVVIYEYKPNEIKLGITGHGHADKKQISRMLKLHLKGCSIEQDDTADAVAVALYHLQSRKSMIKQNGKSKL